MRFAGTPPSPDPIEATRTWINDIEPKLTAPTLVRDYPARDAAFAVVRGEIAERFEFYWEGVELANAFTELMDAKELRQRWNAANAARVERGRTPYPIDSRLVAAVSRHPRCGGIALGVDRLVMLLLGASSIHEVRVQG